MHGTLCSISHCFVKTFCSHNKPTTNTFQCPRCLGAACAIPSDCYICGLKLISSPHLARSYHHLFPVDAFLDTDGRTSPIVQSPVKKAVLPNVATHCFACQTSFEHAPVSTPTTAASASRSMPRSPAVGNAPKDIDQRRFQCGRCHQCFCYDCDIFIHETLHNCPGCVQEK